MDSMLGESKNLRDISKDSLKDTSSMLASLDKSVQYEVGNLHSQSILLPYTKTNKLVTALYMVTDTMEKEEPIRLKLRTLGVEILSDITSSSKGILDNLEGKISTILSFLAIASDIRIISEMNYNILRKEFVELKLSLKELTTKKHLWLEEFMLHQSETSTEQELTLPEENPSIRHPRFTKMSDNGINMSFNKGQDLRTKTGTRIGVQKGSTLLRALSQVEKFPNETQKGSTFEVIKKQRRDIIIKIIKDKPNGASIKDIASATHDLGEMIGEKTLQRELISMVKDNVLKKTGEKRWSQYFING
jgi:hypothetical protein